MVIAPMKATSGTLPTGSGWVYELKWDGMRILTEVAPDGVRAWTSNLLDATATFPELAALGPALAPATCLLDGEVVALGPDGRPSFGRLQNRMHVSSAAEAARRAVDFPIELVLFDLLAMGEHDTTRLAWRDRRRLLEQLADDLPPGMGLATLFEDGPALLDACREKGLEGIVAKRVDAPYVPGARSRAWIKVKVRRQQEMVVGGWSPGEGNRAGGMGSVLVGYHDAPGASELRYAGKVGSGFTNAELTRVERLLGPLTIAECPFTPRPPPALTRGARWVRPEVVVEVAFGEWTGDGHLRHPVFLGQRTDVDPSAVVREP